MGTYPLRCSLTRYRLHSATVYYSNPLTNESCLTDRTPAWLLLFSDNVIPCPLFTLPWIDWQLNLLRRGRTLIMVRNRQALEPRLTREEPATFHVKPLVQTVRLCVYTNCTGSQRRRSNNQHDCLRTSSSPPLLRFVSLSSSPFRSLRILCNSIRCICILVACSGAVFVEHALSPGRGGPPPNASR